MLLDAFKDSLKDRLTTGGSVHSNTFRQVALDIAKQSLGIATESAYENTTRIIFTEPETQESLEIPVLPREITVKWARKKETVNILNLGEVDFTTGKKLQEISFSSFFPLEYLPTYCRYADIPDPYEAYMTLDAWCAARDSAQYVPDKPVRMVIVGTALDINMLVLITGLEVKDRGGEPGDLYYSITCREWREIKVRTEFEERIRNNRPNPRPKSKTAKGAPKEGESLNEFLYKTAKQHYGNGQSWEKIKSMNMEKLKNGLPTKAVDWVLR